MPLKSLAQEKLLWAKHPDVAQEFEDATSPEQKKHIPEHVSKQAAEEPDAAARFMASFNDPSKWKIVPGVPVFDEHLEQGEVEEPGRDGKPVKRKIVEKFDKASLERHAAKCNRLVESGNPPGLTFGHTQDDGPEEKQPETVGFGRNYRVGFSPTLQRLVIYHDEYIYPHRYEEAKKFPFRSVERWRPGTGGEGEYFKPIAMLKREPRRNLGIVTYRAANGCTVVRYSMKGPAMPEMPPAMEGPGSTNVQPEPNDAMMEPSDRDKALHAKLMAAYMEDPANCEKMKKYFAGEGGASAAGMGSPSGSNTGMPTMPEPEPKPKPKEEYSNTTNNSPGGQAAWDEHQDDPDFRAAVTAGGKNPNKSQAPTKGNVERYAAELQSQRAEIEALKKENRVERYGAFLDGLATREGIQFDHAEELAIVQDYDAEDFAKHVAHMRKRYQKLPVGRVRQADGQEVRRDGGKRMTKEEMQTAVQYAREHPGMSYGEAVEKTCGKSDKPSRNGHSESGLYQGR